MWAGGGSFPVLLLGLVLLAVATAPCREIGAPAEPPLRLSQKCLQPCTEPWDAQRAQCHRKCKSHPECLTSCEFLRFLQTMKQGECPPPHKAWRFVAACVRSCGAEVECPETKKCCSSQCGYTCQPPVSTYKDPLPPDAPKDLRWGNFTVGPDGSLNVIISWDASPKGDLEIHHYKISWNLRVKSELELRGLQANAEYLVEVQAVAFWAQNV